jgi:hypothetical protein
MKPSHVRLLVVVAGIVLIALAALGEPAGFAFGPLAATGTPVYIPISEVLGASGAIPTATATRSPTATPTSGAFATPTPSSTPAATATSTATPTEAALGTCAPLVLSAGKSVDSYLTDEYAWYDASCRRRTAALVRSDPKGGHAKQFTYRLQDGSLRTVGEGPAAGGFGYIVSHLYDPSLATNNGEDDSPLGSNQNAAFRTVFAGAHHAVHEFTLNYPRWGRDPVTNQVLKYSMPVTIHWMFATGRDHPLWAVTFDLSAAPANAVRADTRAPYGEMNFDGVAPRQYGNVVAGVKWGESWRFTSTSPTLTLNSNWTWNAQNTFAPYNLIWTTSPDAEMGIAGTRVITRQDAGGYEGGDGRGGTSANTALRCPPTDDNHVMPCAWKWPFQSVNYSFYDENGDLQRDKPTASKRLAWGADWGTLGQQSVTTINGNTVSGWPKVSYSVFIVLDRATISPTIATAEQARVVENTTLTATVGTVATSGPAGPGRSDTVSYAPTGYNHVYATWEAIASNNRATLTFTVGGGTPLRNPVVVLRQYSGSATPTVTLNGSALQPNVDYFATRRADTQELWITIKRAFSGAQTLNITG